MNGMKNRLRIGGVHIEPTNLGPDHFSQSSDELRGGVNTKLDGLFVHDLSN